MPSSAPIRWSQLPPSIASTLRAAVRRIRRILWTRGLLAVGATAIASILVIMGIDAAFTLYSNTVRWAITLTGAGITALVAWHSLVKPLSRPFTPARIAAILEARHPELEERISTVVEILSSPDAVYAESLSGELFTLLSKEAETDASKVSPKDEFTNRTVKPKFYALAGALAILAVLFCVAPTIVKRLFIRAVNPSAEVDNVFADALTVTPGDAVVLLGEPLSIQLDVKSGFPGLAYVHRCALLPNGSEGPEIAERMRRSSAPTPSSEVPEEGDAAADASPDAGPDASPETPPPAPAPAVESGSVRHYEQTIPVVTSSFKYRIHCGHALTHFYTVTAVEVPDVDSMSITLEYPAYTGREPAVFKDADIDIAALPGTRVTWAATFNREDLSAHLVVPGVKVRHETRTADSSLWTATVDESTNSTWTLSLSDSNGYTNAPVAHVFRAVPDTPPSITLDEPRQYRLRLPPHSKIPLQFTVRDDFGVSTPELWYAATDTSAREVAGGEYQSGADFSLLRAARVFQRMDDGAWHGVDAIDLSTLNLANRKYFQFQLRVSDNLPAELGGPHVTTSSLYTVELDQSALSLSSQSINAQEKRIRQVLEEVVQRLTDSRNTSSNVLEHVRSGGILDDIALEQLSETRRDTAMARTLSMRLVEEIRDSMFRPFADRLSDFTDNEAKAAADRAEEVPLANPQDRLSAIETSENASETARARAEELLNDLTSLADRLRELERLRELAEREKALAEAAEDVKDAEEAEMWKKLQEELEAQLKEELAKDPETFLEMLEKREEKIKELAEEAKKLADEQAELKKDAEDLANPDKRDAAAERLEEKTQDMPEDATPEERLAKLEEDVAEKAEDLRKETKDMRDDLQEFGEPAEPLLDPTKNAAQNLDAAADKAEDAADDLAPKPEEAAADQFADPNQDGQQDQQQQNGQEDGQPPSEETLQKMQDAKELLGDAAKNLSDTANQLDQMKEQLLQAIADSQAAQDENWPEPDYDALADAMENMQDASEQIQQFQDAMEAAQDMKQAMDAQQKAMDALKQAADAQLPQEQRDQAAQEAAEAQQQALDAQQQAMEKMQDAGLDPAQQQQAMDAQQQAMDAREKAEESGTPEDWQQALNAQQQAMDAQQQAGEKLQQQTGMDPQNMQSQDPQQGPQMPQDPQQGQPMPQDQQQAMQKAMQQAQQQAQQAAQQMQQQMQQMMQKMDLPVMPDPNALQDPKNAQEVLKAMARQMQAREHAQEIPEALRGKITEVDWFRIQGDARSGVSGNLNNVPAEYRELVRDYFQALSAGEEQQP